MKKFRTIAVISALALTMVACGSKDKPTKVTPGFAKESAKETVAESVKETSKDKAKETTKGKGKETNKETSKDKAKETTKEKEVGKETKQEANKGTETKPSTPAKPSNPSKPSKPAKPSNPSKPTPSRPSKPNPSKPSKPEPSKPTPSKPAKKKVWVVDVPAKDAVYKTERVLVKPAKDAVYENKTVVVTPEQQKAESKGRFVLETATNTRYDFNFNTNEERRQAYEEVLTKMEDLGAEGIPSRYYEDYHTYYVTIPAVTKTERVLVSEAQDAVYENKKVLVSPAVKEKGHWEWR